MGGEILNFQVLETDPPDESTAEKDTVRVPFARAVAGVYLNVLVAAL
jgi:hypothetical protein